MKLVELNLNGLVANGYFHKTEELAREAFTQSVNVWANCAKEFIFTARNNETEISLYQTKTEGYYIVEVVNANESKVTVYNDRIGAHDHVADVVANLGNKSGLRNHQRNLRVIPSDRSDRPLPEGVLDARWGFEEPVCLSSRRWCTDRRVEHQRRLDRGSSRERCRWYG